MKILKKIQISKIQKKVKIQNVKNSNLNQNRAHPFNFRKDLFVTNVVPTLKKAPTKRFRFPKLLCLQKATRECFMYDGSFQQAIRPALILGQCFSLMPVTGINKTTNHLKFSWLTILTFYSVVLLIQFIFDTYITLYWFLSQKIEFNNMDTIIFHISDVIVSIKFIQLAKEWPELMHYWESIEMKLPQYKSQMEKRMLAYKIKMIIMVAMMLSLTEHVLSIISIIHSVNYCPVHPDVYENFFQAQLSQYFYVFNYNPYLAVYGKIINIYLTFIWNYMDAFVMVVSVGLSSKLKQLNDHLRTVVGKQTPEIFWAESRIHYRNLCNLVYKFDDAISVITMVSFSNNLYFICVQLLKSLNKMPSFAHGLYFYYSLIFLIGRTVAVSLYAADINDESRVPIQVFRCVPKESWCPEVKRFSEEVNNDLVALSGMKYFHLTRKLLLTIAGTIITYELVLIQFHEDDISLGCGA